MRPYEYAVGQQLYRFADLKALLAAASPSRSGDQLAGLAASTRAERVAARLALADVPLKTFLNEALIPYETDEVTRLIVDTHDAAALRRDDRLIMQLQITGAERARQFALDEFLIGRDSVDGRIERDHRPRALLGGGA